MKVFLTTKPPYDGPTQHVIRFYEDEYKQRVGDKRDDIYAIMTLEDYEILLRFIRAWSKDELDFILSSDVTQILKAYNSGVSLVDKENNVKSLDSLERDVSDALSMLDSIEAANPTFFDVSDALPEDSQTNSKSFEHKGLSKDQLQRGKSVHRRRK